MTTKQYTFPDSPFSLVVSLGNSRNVVMTLTGELFAGSETSRAVKDYKKLLPKVREIFPKLRWELHGTERPVYVAVVEQCLDGTELSLLEHEKLETERLWLVTRNVNSIQDALVFHRLNRALLQNLTKF